MSLAGTGAVAIWHDIAPEGRAEFYAWHGEEHMPERVGIPGFRRGRRYVALTPGLEFFNLYETADPDIVKGPDYKARLDSPTPWTLSAVKHFRSVARSLCTVVASHGRGEGGFVGTFRYDVPDAGEQAHRTAMVDRILPALARTAGVAGVHLLRADVEASSVVNAEQRARGTANAIPRWILLVEGWGDRESFEAVCRRFGEDHLPSDAVFGLYALQFSLTTAG